MHFDDFTAREWARIQADWTAWWNGELERPLVVLNTRDPGHPPGGMNDNWPRP